MELGNQIKQHRNRMGLSQEELADKVYVSRQTISNWENDKNYPDIKSLLLLSSFFGVSLDDLVKGDMKEMKEQIKTEDIRLFQKNSWFFTIFLVSAVILFVPLLYFFDWFGIGIWAVVYGIAAIYAFRVEKQKKRYDVHTYKEIIAFCDGKRLDEIESQREYGKRSYQQIFYALATALITFVVMIAMIYLLPLIFPK